MTLKHLFATLTLLLVTSIWANAQTPEQKLKEMGLEIPEVSLPIANYVKWKQVGNLLYLSGGGPKIYGKVGADLSVEEGYQAARETGLEVIAVLKAATGDLSRIKQFVKVLGMVNCVPSFERHPYVINGCSELFASVWGEENGIGVRSAVGMGSLPDNIPVEIEALFELF